MPRYWVVFHFADGHQERGLVDDDRDLFEDGLYFTARDRTWQTAGHEMRGEGPTRQAALDAVIAYEAEQPPGH